MSNKFWKWLFAILITADFALVLVLAYQFYVAWFLAELIQKLT